MQHILETVLANYWKRENMQQSVVQWLLVAQKKTNASLKKCFTIFIGLCQVYRSMRKSDLLLL